MNPLLAPPSLGGELFGNSLLQGELPYTNNHPTTIITSFINCKQSKMQSVNEVHKVFFKVNESPNTFTSIEEGSLPWGSLNLRVIASRV